MQYVGITGFTEREQVLAVLEVVPFWMKLMVGVLVSRNGFAGKRVRLWRRYPTREQLGAIFVDDPRCLNLVHYCADEPPSAREIAEVQAAVGPHCHGFQFNGTWPEQLLLALCNHVVLQVRPPAFNRATVCGILQARRGSVTTVLLDASGGNGVQAQVESVAKGIELFAAERERGGFGLGFAGGLTPENLPSYAHLLRAGLSVDVETGVRDGMDGGGRLDLEKCKRWIESHVSILKDEAGA